MKKRFLFLFFQFIKIKEKRKKATHKAYVDPVHFRRDSGRVVENLLGFFWLVFKFGGRRRTLCMTKERLRMGGGGVIFETKTGKVLWPLTLAPRGVSCWVATIGVAMEGGSC